MGDLSRTQQSQPVQITDDSSSLAALSSGPVGTEVGLVVRNIPFGTQTISGTITANAGTGTQSVNIVASSVTQSISGTVTTVPSGTQAVVGSLSTSPSGTQTVAYGTGTFPVSGTVTTVPSGTQAVVGSLSTSPSGTQTVQTINTTTTNTLTQITVSSSSTTQILASNANRKMAVFYNGGSNFIYLKFGATASATSYTVVIYSNGYYEMPTPVYAGEVDGLANNANTVINVTEL